MLLTLSIENFLIIQHVELDFQNGYTVFTGETGAGKSIFIDALKAALGDAAPASLIREHQPFSEVTARFEVLPNSLAAWWAEQQGIEIDGEMILRRVLNRNGRGKAYLNGKLCPLALLQECGKHLVHIHGQHAHQQLLNMQTARAQLDRYANHESLVKDTEHAYLAYQQLLKQKRSPDSLHELSQRLSFLQFQLEELDALQLTPGEMDALYEQHRRLHHLQEYATLGAQLFALLNAEDTGITAQLVQAQQLLKHLPTAEKTLENIKTLFENAWVQCDEASSELSHWSEGLKADPDVLNTIEHRMSTLHQMARKYRSEPAELLTVSQRLREEYDALEGALQDIPLLDEKIHEASQHYQALATQLSALRQKNALTLSNTMTERMRQLGMTQGCFQVQCTPHLPGDRHGIDKVDYQVVTHPGMSFQSLSKVASGGELSRISLALELMTAEKTCMPILIFDEVDVGIGGKTAAIVGQLLRQLGERVQVFNITHQPQVAAFAHHHWHVEKQSDAHSTCTHIRPLSLLERTLEIARMLDGIEPSEAAQQHAQHLIDAAID